MRLTQYDVGLCCVANLHAGYLHVPIQSPTCCQPNKNKVPKVKTIEVAHRVRAIVLVLRGNKPVHSEYIYLRIPSNNVQYQYSVYDYPEAPTSKVP